jgi:hypothetical protein
MNERGRGFDSNANKRLSLSGRRCLGQSRETEGQGEKRQQFSHAKGSG